MLPRTGGEQAAATTKKTGVGEAMKEANRLCERADSGFVDGVMPVTHRSAY
jgi:hypothetical protein